MQQYNDFNKVIKAEYGTMFIDSEDNKKFDPNILLLNFSNKKKVKKIW